MLFFLKKAYLNRHRKIGSETIKNVQQTNTKQNEDGMLNSDKVDFKVKSYWAIKTLMCGAGIDKWME